MAVLGDPNMPPPRTTDPPKMGQSSRTQRKKKKKSVEAPERNPGARGGMRSMGKRIPSMDIGPSMGMINRKMPMLGTPMPMGAPIAGGPMLPEPPMLQPQPMGKIMEPPLQPSPVDVGPSPNVPMGGPIANPTNIGNIVGGMNPGMSNIMKPAVPTGLGGLAGRLQPQRPSGGLFGAMNRKPTGSMGY